MNTIHYTAFLCGGFSIKSNYTPLETINSEWKKVVKTQEEKDLLKKYYYPEFVDFCYKDNCSDKQGMERYTMPLNRKMEIEWRTGKMLQFEVERLDVYILPYNLLLYSIKIIENDTPLDDVTASISMLRNVCDYTNTATENFCNEILFPIAEIYKSCASSYDKQKKPFVYTNLIEFGNKLKAFQIAEVPMSDTNGVSSETLLFELGTLAPIDSLNSKASSATSFEYFEKTIKEHKVSIYNNWKALSIFDTFTILSCSVDKWLRDNWNDYYFGMLYVYSLFTKYYLFRMNLLFRNDTCDAVVLEKEFTDFERSCRFNKISYNFLPQEVYTAIDKAQDIRDENEKLYHMIEQEKRIQEEKSERKLSNFLLLLTFLAAFSAIWDFACLINELYPFAENMGSSVFGFRVVSGVLVVLLLIALFVIVFSKRKK